MGKRYKHLFDRITNSDNFWEAYRKASKGKRSTVGYLAFKQDEAANLMILAEKVKAGTYSPSKSREFMVFEPKPRSISALSFSDRVVQHALCNVIEPIFDKVFLPQSFACRQGKGTHRAAVSIQSMLRRAIKQGGNPVVLKTDFSKYFASIDLAVLHGEIARKVSCKKSLRLLELFISRSGVGIPIGNLTSQLAANIYGHIVDRWLVHTVGISNFARYMDDIVVIGHSNEAMQLLQTRMEMFAISRMGLSFSHWSIQPASRGVNFVGYRIWPTHKLLRKSSVQRARRKLKILPDEQRLRFLAAWHGHIKHADCKNLAISLGVGI